jgi:hypothetical protein
MHACTICWSKSEAHIMQLHIMQRSLTSSFSRSPEGGLMNLPDVLLKQQPSIVERHRTRGVGGWGGKDRDRDKDGVGRGREAAKEREQKDRATAALR